MPPTDYLTGSVADGRQRPSFRGIKQIVTLRKTGGASLLVELKIIPRAYATPFIASKAVLTDTNQRLDRKTTTRGRLIWFTRFLALRPCRVGCVGVLTSPSRLGKAQTAERQRGPYSAPCSARLQSKPTFSDWRYALNFVAPGCAPRWRRLSFGC